jgi:DNA-binding GntR family transcriptional regulator
LVRLESEGLVTKRSLKGYAAAELLDSEGMRQLFEMRLLLEPAAARLAASHLTEDFISALDPLASAMQGEVESAQFEDGTFDGYRSFQSHDARFHGLIAAQSGNELLRDAFLRLRVHMHLFRFYFDQRIAIDTAPEHNAIVEALRQGDADGAEQAMRSHIEHSFDRMKLALSQR